jgi:hypothetical protein
MGIMPPFVSDRCPCSGLEPGSPFAPRHPIHRPANQQIGDNGQQKSDKQRREQIDPAQNQVLVDEVHDGSEDENLGDRLPAFTYQLSPARRLGKDCPEVRNATCSRIFQAIADREDRSHDWLEDKAKLQWSIQSPDEMTPHPIVQFVHSFALLYYTRCG